MSTTDNDVTITLPPIPHQENIRGGDDGVPEFTEHHDFAQSLRDTLEESPGFNDGVDASLAASRIVNALAIDFPDDEPEVEGIEADGFSPSSPHGHFTQSTGDYAVTHHPVVHVDVIDLVPLLEHGITASELRENMVIAISEMGIDMNANEVKIVLSNSLEEGLSPENVTRQRALDNGHVLVPTSLASNDDPVIRADDLWIDYPLENEIGHLSVRTVGGGQINLPVLSESMFQNMQKMQNEGHFDPFPEGVTAMSVVAFSGFVDGRVLSVHPHGSTAPTELIPPVPISSSDWKAEHVFSQQLADNLRRYQHVNGIAEAVTASLNVAAPSQKDKARWINGALNKVSQEDKEAAPSLYNSLQAHCNAIVSSPENDNRMSGLKNR